MLVIAGANDDSPLQTLRYAHTYTINDAHAKPSVAPFSGGKRNVRRTAFSRFNCPPAWIKLERKGDQFNGYYATDGEGKAWMPMVWNPQTITMDAQVYVGLAVTSHVAGVVTQAEFSNVATTGSVTGSWESVSLTVEQPVGNLPDAFYLAVEDAGGRTATVIHSDPLAVGVGTWTPWSIPLSELTSAGVKTDRIKKIIIGIGDRTKPASGASGLIYIDDIAYGRPASQ